MQLLMQFAIACLWWAWCWCTLYCLWS